MAFGKNALRVLSLFSGCGGLDLGLEGGFLTLRRSVNEEIHPDWIQDCVNRNFVRVKKNRFQTVFANDILPCAQKAWNHFFGTRKEIKGIYRLKSIVDLVKESKQGTFRFPQNIDVVTGGFPCQDFSVAGKRLGFDSAKSHNGVNEEHAENESRGTLYLWMKQVIEIVKPKIFIAENVKGLVSLGDAKKIIETDFRNIDQGYCVVDAQVLKAWEYGVPQSRERIVFIGISRKYANPKILADIEKNSEKSLYYPYPIKTHGEGLQKIVTCKDAFVGLKEPDESSDAAQKAYSKAKYYGKMQGSSEVDMNGVGPTIRSEHHGNIEYRRLSKEHGGKILSELTKGLQERRLSVRECARIQTFPDDYEFIFNDGINKVNSSDAYKVIGNAVPPMLGYAIGFRLQSIWEDLFGG
ncbi:MULTISPECIES: DNA (cytosine-5-)-methyltransferase [Hallerella]|uniref:DNA cytosine methyltransferase n=1 Tax=Hallerella TaxID=2815788 RepID=UPI000D0C9BE8|nr:MULTISPECIES: DNA (cytosine-5-)-methyltransferase [Hallerella]MCI6874477.1 DNA (cytosine-5-)-methyltransferase [Hallerella sp.]MDD6091867.1 DNA (cytosine-5-)-methyltransferase [Hallerella succinigenes]